MAKPIRSEKLFAALQEAGAIPKDGPPVRRMVLDLTAGQAAILYVEYLADENWVTVSPLIAGVQVVTRKDVPVPPHNHPDPDPRLWAGDAHDPYRR